MAYYLDYKRGGSRKSYRIGPVKDHSPEAARRIAKKLIADIAYGIDPQAEKQKAERKWHAEKLKTLGGFIEHKYGPWVKSERKTGGDTLARIQYNFGYLNKRPLSEITPWIIDKWRSEQKKKGKAATTINRDVVALRAALSKAVEWGVIDAHPLSGVKPIKTDTNKKIRYLSDDEDKRLRDALKARDDRIKAGRASGNEWRRSRGYELLPDLNNCTYADHLTPMVILTLNTGLRRGETFELIWPHVNLHTKILTVDGDKAKSGKTRHIPLNDEAVTVLQSWRDQTQGDGLVFPGKDGKPLESVRKAWGGVLKEANITNFRWHDLRHDFASKLVMAGVPLNTVRELLGHSDLNTTLRYAHLGPDHKADAVAALNR